MHEQLCYSHVPYVYISDNDCAIWDFHYERKGHLTKAKENVYDIVQIIILYLYFEGILSTMSISSHCLANHEWRFVCLALQAYKQLLLFHPRTAKSSKTIVRTKLYR